MKWYFISEEELNEVRNGNADALKKACRTLEPAFDEAYKKYRFLDKEIFLQIERDIVKRIAASYGEYTRKIHMIVSDIAKQYGVKKVALFGSYSTGKQTPESDIDLLIDKGDIKGLFMLNSFINSLQDKLGKDVDVMTYSSLSRSLIKNSVKDEVVLYECQR